MGMEGSNSLFNFQTTATQYIDGLPRYGIDPPCKALVPERGMGTQQQVIGPADL
jgi:hypothetical protein